MGSFELSQVNQRLLGRIKELAREASESEGCRLYDFDFSSGPHGRVLRVYIDKKGSSISVDDCANVSRGLNLLLDTEDVIPGGAYELEVSSPGVERKLKEDWHFHEATGEWIKVKTMAPIPVPDSDKGATTKLVEGDLVSVDDEKIVVKKGEANWEIPRDMIAKANIVFRFEEASSAKQKKKRGK